MSAVKKLSWLSLLIVVFFLLSSFAVRNSDRRTRALVLRLQIVVFLESILSLGSLYIWHNISQLFPPQTHHDNKVSTAEKSVRPGRKMLRPPSIRRRLQALWKLFLFTILVSAQLCYPLGVTYVSVEPYTFVLFSYICMGIHMLLTTNIILCLIIGKIFETLFCPKNKKYFAWMAFVKVAVVVVATGLLSYLSVARAFKGPTVKKLEIPISNLPKSFDGMRIVQISDVHLGPTVGKSQLESVMQLTNSLNPDLVSITGDLVDAPVSYLTDAALPLTQLGPKYGTYFVTGNHEYYTGDVDAWISYLTSIGVKCLHNENVKIKQCLHNENVKNEHEKQADDFFYLAGTDDIQGERFNYGDHGFKLEKALDGTDQDHVIILLAHRPAAAYAALSADRGIKLVLSGHTHGGQLFPALIWVYFLNPYFTGLYQHSPTSYVYVSSGTFYWGIPMRLFSTPEITLITLRAV